MITKNTLSNILYRYDPMSTTCTSNKMYDEYDSEANEIIDLLTLGVSFKHAYFSTMSNQFWVERSINSYPDFVKIQLEYYNHTV